MAAGYGRTALAVYDIVLMEMGAVFTGWLFHSITSINSILKISILSTFFLKNILEYTYIKLTGVWT